MEDILIGTTWSALLENVDLKVWNVKDTPNYYGGYEVWLMDRKGNTYSIAVSLYDRPKMREVKIGDVEVGSEGARLLRVAFLAYSAYAYLGIAQPEVIESVWNGNYFKTNK